MFNYIITGRNIFAYLYTLFVLFYLSFLSLFFLRNEYLKNLVELSLSLSVDPVGLTPTTLFVYVVSKITPFTCINFDIRKR